MKGKTNETDKVISVYCVWLGQICSSDKLLYDLYNQRFMHNALYFPVFWLASCILLYFAKNCPYSCIFLYFLGCLAILLCNKQFIVLDCLLNFFIFFLGKCYTSIESRLTLKFDFVLKL